MGKISEAAASAAKAAAQEDRAAKLRTGVGVPLWLPAMDLSKLKPPLPSGLRDFAQRINADFPPNKWKGVPIV